MSVYFTPDPHRYSSRADSISPGSGLEYSNHIGNSSSWPGSSAANNVRIQLSTIFIACQASSYDCTPQKCFLIYIILKLEVRAAATHAERWSRLNYISALQMPPVESSTPIKKWNNKKIPKGKEKKGKMHIAATTSAWSWM
jgi:hypothetical protein